MKTVRITLFGFALLIISIVLLIVIVKFVNRYSNRIRSRNGIEYQGYLNINGYKQWIYIRGENKDNPIILYLHGGPGSPESGMARKKYQNKIENDFVMVHWEQRGSTKSYSSDLENDKLTFDNFVDDATTLSQYLIKTYGKEKIYLIGHSFGSMIGLELISRHPELFYAYIGIGQFVNAIDQENISRQFVLNKAVQERNEMAIRELTSIGTAPYKNVKKDIFLQRKYLTNSTGWVGKNYSLTELAIDAIVFPHYSFGDYIKAYKGAMYSLNQMLNKEYWNIAFDKTITNYQIPVYFISGSNDYNTPTTLVKKYFSMIDAPRKELVIIENCGHLVNFEEPDKFNNEVCRLFGFSK